MMMIDIRRKIDNKRKKTKENQPKTSNVMVGLDPYPSALYGIQEYVPVKLQLMLLMPSDACHFMPLTRRIL